MANNSAFLFKLLTPLVFKRRTQALSQDVLELSRGLYLAPLMSADFEDWCVLRKSQNEFLQPWEPKWASNEFTRASFKARAKQAKQNFKNKTGANFLLKQSDGTLMGGVNLFNVRRGASNSASIGYWLAKQHNGFGYMSEAVTAACGYAFNEMNLKRLEASCLLTNIASKNVLLRCGFKEEGVCRSYLEINGKREDHLLFALIKNQT